MISFVILFGVNDFIVLQLDLHDTMVYTWTYSMFYFYNIPLWKLKQSDKKTSNEQINSKTKYVVVITIGELYYMSFIHSFNIERKSSLKISHVLALKKTKVIQKDSFIN